MKCIVLSGATVPFTELVKAIDHRLVDVLVKYGYTQIEVQFGHANSAFDSSLPHTKGFDFDSQLAERVRSCDLVITHAGAGSILDSVERGYGEAHRKVVVVVNNKLMNNHQLELARELEKQGCVALCRSPGELEDSVVHAMNRTFLKMGPPQSLQPIVNQVLI